MAPPCLCWCPFPGSQASEPPTPRSGPESGPFPHASSPVASPHSGLHGRGRDVPGWRDPRDQPDEGAEAAADAPVPGVSGPSTPASHGLACSLPRSRPGARPGAPPSAAQEEGTQLGLGRKGGDCTPLPLGPSCGRRPPRVYCVTVPLSCDTVSACVEPPINLWSPPGPVSVFPGSRGARGSLISRSVNAPCAERHVHCPATEARTGRGDRFRPERLLLRY